MITTKFTTGKKASYYEVRVGVNHEGTTSYHYSFSVVTKAPYDAVISALRASLKDSYTLEVGVEKMYHTEYESLDSACALLNRLRFVEYTTKTVEKIVYVKETVTTEL